MTERKGICYFIIKMEKTENNKGRRMGNFFQLIEQEIRREEQLLKQWNSKLESAPKGYISARKRKFITSYYWNREEGRGENKKQVQKNITDNKGFVLQLVEKQLAKKISQRCESNLRFLRKLRRYYKAVDINDILRQLPETYCEIIKLREKKTLEARLNQPYKKAPFNSLSHKHETDYGELVRSKSEQLIANALYAYGIPFHYEEIFVYRKGVGSVIYPDFTILLPDGNVIIWEHLGLLSDLGYCQRTAEKLNIYQQNGYTIGKNLILTMDDSNQNVSSVLINHIIETQILPHFAKGGIAEKRTAAAI